MSRVWLIPVVALLTSLIPSVVHAQTYVVPLCTDPAVMSRSMYARPVPCVPLVPVPPTGPGPVGAIRPAPVVPIPMPMPVYVPPSPVYVSPAAPSSSGGLNPWLPLAVRPAPVAAPSDLVGQMLLWQAIAAARSRPQPAPTPLYVAPRPPPASAPGDGWMSGFIKSPKQ